MAAAYTVKSYDCGTDDATIETLAAIVEKQQEGIYPPDGVEVTHFTRGCKEEIYTTIRLPRYAMDGSMHRS